MIRTEEIHHFKKVHEAEINKKLEKLNTAVLVAFTTAQSLDTGGDYCWVFKTPNVYSLVFEADGSKKEIATYDAGSHTIFVKENGYICQVQMIADYVVDAIDDDDDLILFFNGVS